MEVIPLYMCTSVVPVSEANGEEKQVFMGSLSPNVGEAIVLPK
jgi:hypothetical protein